MSALPDDAPIPPSAPTTSRWLVLVLFVALAAHAWVYFFFHYEPSNDEKEYLALGISLAEQGELRLPTGEYAKRMPLYPALLAAVKRWQGREVLQSGVVGLQTILSLLSTLLIALTARRISDARGAVVAGLIAALYSPYRYLQAVMLSETLVIFLLLGALFLYVVALQSPRPSVQWSSLAAVSALLGLSVLTRADACLFALPFAIHAACRAGAIRPRVMRTAVLLLGIIVATLSWSYRNSRVIGAWTLSTTGGLNFYLGNNEDYAAQPGMDHADYDAFDRLRREEGLSEAEADARLYAKGRAFITDHPGETVANVFRKTRVWLSSSVTWSAPGTLVIIAWTLVSAGRTSRHRPALITLAVLLSLLWLIIGWRTQRPWTNPGIVVPLGLIGLLVFNDRLKIRWLLLGLFLSQLLVAVVYIPLERLRWTVDSLLIIALGAAVIRVCEWFDHRSSDGLRVESGEQI